MSRGDCGRSGSEEDGMTPIGRHWLPPWTTAVELIPPPHMKRRGCLERDVQHHSHLTAGDRKATFLFRCQGEQLFFFATNGGIAKNPFVKVEHSVRVSSARLEAG